VAACGSAGIPRLTNAQVQRWLAAVQSYSNDPATASTCFLVPRAQLATAVAHPSSAWVVEGYNDQTGDSRRFAGCGIRAVSGQTGDGEIGIELTSAVGHDPDPATVTRALPGTRWTLSVTAWPGTARTSGAQARRVEEAVVAALATPPTDPSLYAGPATTLP
jgi:hypothetical protein